MEKIANALTIDQIMSASPTIIRPDSSLRHVFKLMKMNGFRQLPVVDSGRLVGIITDRDLRLALSEPDMETISWGNDARLDRLKTEAYMTTDPKTVTPSTPIQTAAKLLVEHKIGALPVVENELIVGIVTTTDLLKLFFTE